MRGGLEGYRGGEGARLRSVLRTHWKKPSWGTPKPQKHLTWFALTLNTPLVRANIEHAEK